MALLVTLGTENLYIKLNFLWPSILEFSLYYTEGRTESTEQGSVP